MLEKPETARIVDKKQMKSIIQDLLDGTFRLFDTETMADYDADFSGAEPYIINIWNKQPGSGFGYLVFHDFLRRVGLNKTFVSSDFTEPGDKLFQKAVTDGLIKKISEPFGLQRMTRWQVVGDPAQNLKRLRDNDA